MTVKKRSFPRQWRRGSRKNGRNSRTIHALDTENLDGAALGCAHRYRRLARLKPRASEIVARNLDQLRLLVSALRGHEERIVSRVRLHVQTRDSLESSRRPGCDPKGDSLHHQSRQSHERRRARSADQADHDFGGQDSSPARVVAGDRIGARVARSRGGSEPDRLNGSQGAARHPQKIRREPGTGQRHRPSAPTTTGSWLCGKNGSRRS
jgi:hypothetical protein